MQSVKAYYIYYIFRNDNKISSVSVKTLKKVDLFEKWTAAVCSVLDITICETSSQLSSPHLTPPGRTELSSPTQTPDMHVLSSSLWPCQVRWEDDQSKLRMERLAGGLAQPLSPWLWRTAEKEVKKLGACSRPEYLAATRQELKNILLVMLLRMRLGWRPGSLPPWIWST